MSSKADYVVEVIIAKTDAEITACFPVFKVLRPHLEPSTFVTRVRRQKTQGYVMAFIRNGDKVVTAAGFRLLEFLAWGRVLYVDDLVTDPATPGQGFGGAMMDWLADRARQETEKLQRS